MEHTNWLKWRKSGIGASDAIVLMGVAPRGWGINTPYKLYLDKTQGYHVQETPSMSRGKEFEEEALSIFGKKIGEIFVSQRPYEHSRKNWMRATLDGINIDETVSVETKVCKKEIFEQVEAGEMPLLYKPQVLHQKEVGPAKHHFLSIYNPDYKEEVHIEVADDPIYLKQMMDVEENFWNDHVAVLNPPDLTDWDYMDMESNEDWKRHCEALKALNSKVEMAKEILNEEKAIKDRLKKICPDFSAVGDGVTMTRFENRGAIDYTKIPELEGVDLEKYRKPAVVKYLFNIH